VLVDAHAHMLPRDYPKDAPACFPQMEPATASTDRTLIFGATRFRARDVFFEAERRLEAQDASGVDAEVLTPMPPLLRYDLAVADGLALARHVNEVTAQLCSFDPARLVGLGMVPLQDPDAAAVELAAIGDLGLAGVEIASNVLGASIGEERFLPFFAEAARLSLAVFVHAMPGANDRLPRKATGTFVVGLEGALAAASLITGFYYDTLVFDRRAVRFLVDYLGPDRLLVGSDFPAMPREDPAGRTLRSLDLSPAVLEDITWNNAFRWLGVKPDR
jgi:aminocarboxymuconate-semialdehyde decarboxylase